MRVPKRGHCYWNKKAVWCKTYEDYQQLVSDMASAGVPETFQELLKQQAMFSVLSYQNKVIKGVL